MSSMITVKIEGVEAMVKALEAIPHKLRRRALRNALAAGARLVRDEARMIRNSSTAGSPIGGNEVMNYTRGSVARAISVRTSRVAARAGDVGVFVNVRPAKAAKAGRSNPTDPFYWRFLEFGTRFMAARPFLQPAAGKLADALTKFEQVIGPQIQKLDVTPKDAL